MSTNSFHDSDKHMPVCERGKYRKWGDGWAWHVSGADFTYTDNAHVSVRSLIWSNCVCLQTLSSTWWTQLRISAWTHIVDYDDDKTMRDSACIQWTVACNWEWHQCTFIGGHRTHLKPDHRPRLLQDNQRCRTGRTSSTIAFLHQESQYSQDHQPHISPIVTLHREPA